MSDIPSRDALIEALMRAFGFRRNFADAILDAILPLVLAGAGSSERAKAGLSEAVIEEENIVIRVPISTLPIAFTYWPDAPRDGQGNPLYRVTDAAEWARSIVCRLNDEGEDGTTRIHRMLDDAMNEAFEQGDEGIEEVAALAQINTLIGESKGTDTDTGTDR